jgi:2-methylcitrate dehydratase
MSEGISRRHLVAGIGVCGLSGLTSNAFAAQAVQSESMVRPLAERLAAYAGRLGYHDLSAETVEAVKSHLIDTIGCGVAAFDEKPVQICRDIVLAASGGVSTVIGTNRRAPPDLAAFANGAAFRYYDMNDAYVGRVTGHPSDHIAACLAVAEAERSSAEELITSIVLAYEVNCRLVDAFDISTRGWDPPVFSPPAVALAVGKLMKLDLEKLTQAVNLATNDHIPMGQTRVQTISDWKGLADAEAGRNAIFATQLARAGLTGPAPIFEGHSGFIRLITGPGEVDVEAFGRPGVPFRINDCGMKAYPAQVHTQTAIVAAIALAKEVGDLSRIAAIDIATTRRGFQMNASEPEKWAPNTKETADHSLPYITARAMFEGDINNDSYTPEKLHDPRIIAFMQKIRVKEDPAFATPAGNAPSARITATLDDGRSITRQVDNMPGFPGQPMSRADVERKFHSNVGKRWPQERTDAILQALWDLDRAHDLPGLLGKLSLQA